MPTYEYQCFACGHAFEAVQRMSDEALKTCPVCNKDEVKRLISATAFHLKGTGWYKTDYSKSAEKKGASEPKKEKPEAKAAETKATATK